MRNINIDIARFVFAFLVVVIHVPLLGAGFIMPLARCAVPFFYIVTGYYVYNKEESILLDRLNKSVKKWLMMWLVYSVLIYTFVLTINILLDAELGWHTEDYIKLLLNGNCRPMDVIIWDGEPYGVNVLWFLYCGFIGLLLLKVIPTKHWNKLFLLTFICYIAGLTYNYLAKEMIIPRLIISALPSLYCGVYIRKKECCKEDSTKLKTRRNYLTLFLVAMYIENFIIKEKSIKNDLVFMTIPFTVMLFDCIKNSDINLKNITFDIPAKITLDIYLWHRLIYFLFSMLSLAVIPIAAIQCYVSIFVISYMVRNIKIKKQ